MKVGMVNLNYYIKEAAGNENNDCNSWQVERKIS